MARKRNWDKLRADKLTKRRGSIRVYQETNSKKSRKRQQAHLKPKAKETEEIFNHLLTTLGQAESLSLSQVVSRTPELKKLIPNVPQRVRRIMVRRYLSRLQLRGLISVHKEADQWIARLKV